VCVCGHERDRHGLTPKPEHRGGLWETWLALVAAHGGLAHYVSRLKGPKEQCAIAFNEIAVAHFFVSGAG
jgi:hypothetical protein